MSPLKRIVENTTTPTWANIDPEGRVTATWNTWIMIAGAIFALTMIYADVRQIPKIVEGQRQNREALIRHGLLDASNTAAVVPTKERSIP